VFLDCSDHILLAASSLNVEKLENSSQERNVTTAKKLQTPCCLSVTRNWVIHKKNNTCVSIYTFSWFVCWFYTVNVLHNQCISCNGTVGKIFHQASCGADFCSRAKTNQTEKKHSLKILDNMSKVYICRQESLRIWKIHRRLRDSQKNLFIAGSHVWRCHWCWSEKGLSHVLFRFLVLVLKARLNFFGSICFLMSAACCRNRRSGNFLKAKHCKSAW